MFVPFPYSFRGDGTSRWFWYGLFLSLSENVPGVMPPKAVTYSQLLIGTLPAHSSVRSQSNVDASAKYVRHPAMRWPNFRFNSLGG